MARRLLFSGIIFILVSVVAAAGSFSSFPDGHWVYEAVGSLAESSVIDEDVPEQLNRFEVALLLSRALQQMERSEIDSNQRFGVSRDVSLSDIVLQYNKSVTAEEQMQTADVDWLRKLALEFRTELEVLGYAVRDDDTGVSASPFSAPTGLGYDPVVRENLRRPYMTTSGQLLFGFHSPVAEEPEQEVVNRELRVLQPGQVPDLNAGSLAMVPWNRPEGVPVSAAIQFEDGPKVAESRIPLGSDLLLGARLVEEPTEEGLGIAGVSGQYFISPDFSVEGEYLQNTETSFGSGAVSVGATVRLGDLELGGVVRSVQPGFQDMYGSENPLGATGYGFSLRVGDLVLNTMRDERVLWDASDERQVTTSLDLRYNLPNSASISAGFRQTDSDLRPISELGAPSMTTLGFDLPIPQGRLRLGLASEWGVEGTSERGDFWEASSGLTRSGESYSRTTATVGLSYAFDGDTAFQLNYKLIDFSGFDASTDEQKSNMATAEFSIRF